jgi:hypothetical protein
MRSTSPVIATRGGSCTKQYIVVFKQPFNIHGSRKLEFIEEHLVEGLEQARNPTTDWTAHRKRPPLVNYNVLTQDSACAKHSVITIAPTVNQRPQAKKNGGERVLDFYNVMHVVLRNDQVGSALLDHVVHPRRVNLPLTVQATPTKKQSKREKKTSYQKSMCVRSLRGITNRERCRKRRAHLPMASTLMVLRWASHPAAKMFYRGPTRVRAKIAAIRKKRTRTFLGAVPGTCRLRRGRRIWPSPPPWPRLGTARTPAA